MMRRNGFTLIELIITIALLAIAATFAVPSYRSLVQSNRATTQANELLAAFQLARTEAVKRGLPVAVCASATVNDDNPVCVDEDASNWSTGWIVFVDDGGSRGQRDTTGADAEDLVRVFNAIEGDDDLQNTTFGLNAITGTSLGYVVFGGNGFLLEGADGATGFDLELPDCNGEGARSITINVAGRPRVERVACDNT